MPPSDQEALARNSYRQVRDLFSIPRPVKTLFDSVPVQTYPPNHLPARSPTSAKLPTLYVFGTEADCLAGKPSFNPSCLRWQAFLKIAEVEHRLLSSNNHASPTGVLPFLIPAVTSANNSLEVQLPIPSSKMNKYVLDRGAKVSGTHNIRYEAYQSLLDHRIRSAWLYALYLEPLNFESVARPRYVTSTSRSVLVQTTIAYQLQSAAETELLKYSAKIDVDDLYSEADKAFEALSLLLGEKEWFFEEGSGGDGPGLFDASVFAYTHLLLEERMGWKEKKLQRCVKTRENLVRHRDRLLEIYWS